MLEFYTFSGSARICITLILGLCVLSQTLALVLNFYRRRLNIGLGIRNLLEVLILGEILIFAILHGQVITGYANGFLVPTGYEILRILTFSITLIIIISVCLVSRTFLPLRIIPSIAMSLPIMENLLGPAFPWFFIGGLLFFLLRSIRICITSILAIKTNISALSVMRAIDTLHTGVLFSTNYGYTLLANHQMQNLMFDITGKAFRNAIRFYNSLVSDQYKSSYEKTELDGQMVYLLADGTAWMFVKTDILLGVKSYIHISASDVTETWKLTTKLQVQDQELRHKRDKLKETMSNPHILSKDKEIKNAKIRAHDILGQRLSVLLRIIQNEDDIDYDLLTSLSKGLLAELKIEHNETRPYDELESIQQIFSAIGVDIRFKGQFPKDRKKAKLFIDIIREGSTNAVRHGFATEITIEVKLVDEVCNLIISNNGHIATSPIILGSGIRTLRKKVDDQGGNLNVIERPVFALSVVLPGGD